MSGLSEIITKIVNLDLSGLYEFSPVAIFFILFFATFITEDVTCLAAGALVGDGRISFALAVFACFAGIFVSDIGLYWIGRISGNSFGRTAFFNRLISKRRLKRATLWLTERGAMAILISRFVSGLRLPTYLAAGFLRTSFPKFTFYFFVAAAIWTPILVGSAAFATTLISPSYILLIIVVLFFLLRFILSLSTWRRRRLLIGRLKRIVNWEFWSLKVFYFPVVIYIFFLGLKHRSLTMFTASNPAIPGGGFIGESKEQIYQGLAESGGAEKHLLVYIRLDADIGIIEKTAAIEEFMEAGKLDYPIVIKPDVGERGKGIAIVKSRDELEVEVLEFEEDMIVQEYSGGEEVSIFYYRYPSKQAGKIFSITVKQFPKLVGDGESTLETLILKDNRAVCLAAKYFDQNEADLESIPEKGEEVQIVDIGTHSRGAIFGDGGSLITEQLEREIDIVCRGYEGFYFGRFDIKTPSFESLKSGEDFKIIELNGVTSESTNIYDKRFSLLDAYRILFDQWRIAFEIGAENYRSGATRTSALDLTRMLFGWEVPVPDKKRENAANICV